MKSINKGSEILLNEAEIRLARYLGKARPLSNRSAGVVDRKAAPENQDIETDAVAAEIAMCKALNVYPDLTIEPRSKGANLEVFGIKIDVKQTRLENGRLIVNAGKIQSDTHVYVLLTGEIPKFVFRGFYLKYDVFNDKWKKNFGKHK